ncbi:hypothetical protein ACFL6D_04355 [Spirochaetota bacterium]
MREWIKINGSCKELEKDITRQLELDIEPNRDLIRTYMKTNACWDTLVDVIDDLTIMVSFFQNSDIETNIIIDRSAKAIYLREFFYNSMVGEVLNQFRTYLIYIHVSLHALDPDVEIDLFQHMNEFISKRTLRLSEEEFSCLMLHKDAPEKDIHIKGLLFISLIHGNKLSRLSYFENKIIKEILGTYHAKKMLGLKESSYKYIESGNVSTEEYLEEQKIFHTLKEEFDNKGLCFDDYVADIIPQKNILIWNWWTISPFVAVDVSILLPMIYETKHIQHIYVDLPEGSNDILNRYILNEINDDEVVEHEIKKIYPPIMKDFQKETLPYMILLTKMRELGIPIRCFGKDGVGLLENEPVFISKNIVRFPVDKEWERIIGSHLHNIEKYDDELVMFILFMKPMYTLPWKTEDERIEKIIHTDRFTGFGPDRPGNKLSVYSRHIASSQKSFILPQLDRSSFKDDPVVYFPYTDDDLPRLDDTQFNKFYLYNTMIYSSHTGGGGGGRDRDFQYTDPSLNSIFVS